MTLDEMKELKKQRGYTNERISDGSGVPLGTVRKVFSGETQYPRFETLQKLEKFFSSPYLGNYRGPVYDFYPDRPPVLVKDKEALDYTLFYDGAYTAEDLDRLRGGDGRGELIDGRLFNLAAPTIAHQRIQGRLVTLLNNHVDANGGDCIPLGSPVDVYIEKNDKTILQPDILVLCDKDKLQNDRIWGAPDLIIEILSPSNRENDMFFKLAKYHGYGVREYWIVDPMKERIVVFDFSQGDIPELYTFHDKVPVAIWNGDLEIDFKPIAEEIKLAK